MVLARDLKSGVNRKQLYSAGLLFSIPLWAFLYWLTDISYFDLETNYVWLWPLNALIAFVIARLDHLWQKRSRLFIYLLGVFVAYEVGAYFVDLTFDPIWSLTNLIEVAQVGLLAYGLRPLIESQPRERFLNLQSGLAVAAITLSGTTLIQSLFVWWLEGGILVDLVISWLMAVILPTVFVFVAAYSLSESDANYGRKDFLILFAGLSIFALSDLSDASFYADQMLVLLCLGILVTLPLRLLLAPAMIILLVEYWGIGRELAEFSESSIENGISAANVSVISTITFSGLLIFAAVQERSRRAVELANTLRNQINEGMILGESHLFEFNLDTGLARTLGGKTLFVSQHEEFDLEEGLREFLRAEDLDRALILFRSPGASDVFQIDPSKTQFAETWISYTVGEIYRVRGDRRVLIVRQTVSEFMLSKLNLETALRELSELTEKQKRMFAVIGHELRTPATSINMILDPDNEDRMDEYIEPLRSASKQLLGTLDDLRMVAMPKEAASDRQEVAAIGQLVENTVRALDNQTKNWGFEVKADIQLSMQAEYRFNTQALRQMVTNLVKNACVHSGGRHVWLMLSLQSSDEQTDQLTLLVEDDGKGVPQEHQQQLFDSFFRGDKTREGTGLGLSIVQNLSRLMGGDVQYFESSHGGAGFRVVLNLNRVVGNIEEPSGLISLAGMRAVFAEDNATIQLLTRTLLEKAGVVVASAKDGAEALELFDAGLEYDLVLTDMQMPNLDGVELTKELRARNFKRPIICVSAATIGDETDSILAAGADAVISKPISLDALRATLSKLEG